MCVHACARVVFSIFVVVLLGAHALPLGHTPCLGALYVCTSHTKKPRGSVFNQRAAVPPDAAGAAVPAPHSSCQATGEVPSCTERYGNFRDMKLPMMPRMTILPQAHLDNTFQTKWTFAEKSLPVESLGSPSRYAGCDFYYGPPQSLQKYPFQIRRTPHAIRFIRHENKNENCTEQLLSSQNTPKYGWISKGKAEKCVEARWIAVYGDSTSRILFSAFLDFLSGAIEVAGMPTHDFTYLKHNHIDNCWSWSHCYMAAFLPHIRTVLTFDFVTRVDSFPNMSTTFAKYRDRDRFHAFPQLRETPDLVLLNNGPWEYYGSRWEGDATYLKTMSAFLEQVAKDKVAPAIFIMGNTACPERERNCVASNVSCVHAMSNIDRLQKQITNENALLFERWHSSLRYIDSSALSSPLPAQYHCGGETGYHLPAMITDARLNHVLYAACGSIS